MLQIIKKFWIEVIVLMVAFLVIWGLEYFGLQESLFSKASIFFSLLALLRAYKSDSSTDSSKKFAQYKELAIELEKEHVKISIEKWKEASEVYFIGDDCNNGGIIEEELDWVKNYQEIDKNLKIREINAKLSRMIKGHMRDNFDDYEPVFEFVYKTYKCWDNNMLNIEHVKDLFQKEELNNLLKYGIYFAVLGGNSKEAAYYEPSFTKIAKLVNCSIWKISEYVE